MNDDCLHIVLRHKPEKIQIFFLGTNSFIVLEGKLMSLRNFMNVRFNSRSLC